MPLRMRCVFSYESERARSDKQASEQASKKSRWERLLEKGRPYHILPHCEKASLVL